MMDGKHISRFEAMAQRLIEGSFSRFFGGQVAQQEIANQLMRAMERSYYEGDLATHYEVYLHPDDYERLNDPGVEERLSNYLVQLAQRVGLTLPTRPVVILVANGDIRKRSIHVATRQQSSMKSITQQLQRRDIDDTLEATTAIRKLDAFLIIDGRQHVPLDKPMVTIGRRTDNNIILNSPAVSRKHAQIRWRYGHFVIYDLGSNMGTMVNDEEVVECVLQPGDVITLSNVSLIYGEGATTQARRALRREQGDDVTKSMPAYRPSPTDEE